MTPTATTAYASTGRHLAPSSLPTRLFTGSAAVGAAVLATCLCGMGRIVFGAAAGAALSRVSSMLYAGLVAGALALILVGLAGHSRRAAARAALGTLVFAAGSLLAPPSVMHSMEHTAAHLVGFGLVLAGIGGIVWGFLTAFPTRNRGAASCAAGGFGAAVGCSCCLASGAATWLAVAAFGFTLPGSPFSDGLPYAVFMGAALVGLYRLAGWRYALIALAGAVIAFGGDEALKPLVADDIERIPRLLVSLAGTLVIMAAFVRAFSETRPGEPAPLPRSRGPLGPRMREPAGV